MITIVIPLYNKESQISKTLNSVFAQTFKDFEVIIVNDGSTDSSVQVVKNYLSSKEIPFEESFPDLPPTPSLSEEGKGGKSPLIGGDLEGAIPHSSFHIPHFRLVHQTNQGVSAARNQGIELGANDYIAFLDADDEWHTDYLQTQADLIKKYPEASVFATNYEFKNCDGKISPTILKKIPFQCEDGILSNYFQVASCSHPPLWTSAVVVKKPAIQEVGGFPVGVKSGEDLLTWAKLACQFKIAYSKVPRAIFIFDEKIFNEDQKNRKPENKDFVGDELKRLYLKNKNIKGVKEYVSLWHKMRCRIFISKYSRKKAFNEIIIALSYKINKKNIVFLILTFLTLNLSNKIIKKFS